MTLSSPQEIRKFWFNEIPQKLWFTKDDSFDELLRTRFLEIHKKVRQGEAFSWRETAEGRLAEIIVLDQFSRNMFRGTPDSFSFDAMALVLAQEAVAAKADHHLTTEQKAFLYMPYMHSESPRIHQEAVKLFRGAGLENNLDFELRHKKIIDRFGRYPHRNAILGRTSTPEEKEFLLQPGSGF